MMKLRAIYTLLLAVTLQCSVHYSVKAQSAIAPSVITPSTALESYVNKKDNTFKWEIKDSYQQGDLTVYTILLYSQHWKTVDWTHQLSVLVPNDIQHDGALLFITGGSVKEGMPNWNDKKDNELIVFMSQIASANHAIVALLRQTPNQPLYNGLTEDALISMTLHKYKEDKDFEWPLLFPMVKSAVSAMDAVQLFAKRELNREVNEFVVSGASKRGWTTWLTGAIDKRVKAIAPMVIDVLNMPVSLQYQIETWGDYSIEIQDYVNLGIPQESETPDGKEITTMIDPYSYRNDLNMPKMLLMGTNDPYWVVDNVKNYFDDIPGTNILHYVPNAGHGLGDGQQSMTALSSFVGFTLNNVDYPRSDWTFASKKKNVNVSIRATADRLLDVVVWTASSEDKDFRNDTWTSKSLGIHHKSKIKVKQNYPKNGYQAFYVDLKYENVAGQEYTQSTRVFVVDSQGVL